MPTEAAASAPIELRSAPPVLAPEHYSANMTFSVSWQSLLDELNDLPEDATLISPLSDERFHVTAVEDHRIEIEFLNGDSDDTRELHREMFETLYRRITEDGDPSDLDRLPPNGETYATVFCVHPHISIDESEWVIAETEARTATPVEEASPEEPNRDQVDDKSDPLISMMMDNMGDPQAKVECPIDGCNYSHRSASSVARHVSGSSTAKHIWGIPTMQAGATSSGNTVSLLDSQECRTEADYDDDWVDTLRNELSGIFGGSVSPAQW